MDNAALSRLVAQIYDAGMNPDLWPQAVEAIRAAIGGEVAILFQRDVGIQLTRSEITAVSGWTNALIAPYYSYFGNRDTRSPFVGAVPVGGIYVDDHQMPFEEVERSEIFQDYFRPLGLGHGIAMPLFRELHRQSVFTSHRSLQSGPVPESSVRLLEILAPHLVRAFQLQRQMLRAEALAAGLKLTLDHFPTAVFLVDGRAQVRHMNSQAFDLLAHPSRPLSVSQGRLTARDGVANAQLSRAVSSAAKIAGGRYENAVDIFCFDDGIANIAIMAAPLRPTNDDIGGGDPLVAVFVSEPGQVETLDLERLRQQFGLSKAEARLASALNTGISLADAAARQRVSLETLRTHLKRVFAKTDTRSQGQLIRLLALSLARLRR